jgi:16S rRNA (guanine(1405)-N(7))-methyltransferase
MKREPLVYCQDILLQPPEIKADLAFFFKEAHRFDQRQRGCNRTFWLSLPVKKIAVSLPTSSLTGKHDKIEQHQRLVYESIRDLNWPVQEIVLPSEILFIIQKAV